MSFIYPTLMCTLYSVCIVSTEEAVEAIGPSLKKKFVGVVRFNINNVGVWTLDLKSDSPTVMKGNGGGDKPDLTIIVNDDVFASLYDGKSNAQQAFMKGTCRSLEQGVECHWSVWVR